VSVTQSSVSFKLEAADLEIASRGDTVQVPYETEAPLHVEIDDPSWLKYSIDAENKQILLWAALNPSLTENRSTEVTVSAQNGATALYTQSFTVTQDKNKLSYEDFLGTYTMYYSTTQATAPPASFTRSLTVTLTEKVNGTSYNLGGINPYPTEFPGDITVTYNNGFVSFEAHKVSTAVAGFSAGTGTGTATNPVNVGDELYWLAFMVRLSDNALLSSRTGYDMISSGFDLSNGGLAFQMIDNAYSTDNVAIGFRLRFYSGSTSTSKGDIRVATGVASIYHPKFVKQIP
jgi:hypothetical protein